MVMCMYSKGLPFEPIEGRKVVNSSYKAKGNSSTLLHSGIDQLARLPKDVLLLLFQQLELNELACMSVSCKNFNILVANSRIWEPIAQKIGCFLTRNEPAYVQVVNFIRNFDFEVWGRLVMRGWETRINPRITEFLNSKKMSFELLRAVNLYKEVDRTAVISGYLLTVNDNRSIFNYSVTTFVGENDRQAQAESLKTALFSTHKHRLVNLKVLDLSDYIVPPLLLEEILKVTNLSVIKLKGCGLIHFPPNLLLSRNVKILNLANNAIKEVPGSIISLQNLENLNLNGNELQVLPAELLQIAPQLKKISISNNPMKITSREMKVLHSAKQVRAEGLPRQASIYFRYQLVEDITRVAKYILLALDKVKDIVGWATISLGIAVVVFNNPSLTTYGNWWSTTIIIISIVRHFITT